MIKDRERRCGDVLGVIGIRSGSVGVPNKNVKNLAGKPLVAWIINTARQSRTINRLIVSTDSEEYASIVRSYGAEVPFIRPPQLAQHKSPEIDYVKHLLKCLEENEGYRPSIVVRMMATVPLQIPSDIDAVVDILLKDPTADSAVVIAEARQHPEKALKLVCDSCGGQKLVTYYGNSSKDVTPIARQNYERAYFRANVIACRTDIVFKTDSLTGDVVRHHLIPQERALDIDNLIDFYIAEQLLCRK